jgi:succinyl-CoA synthetase alpha subunit
MNVISDSKILIQGILEPLGLLHTPLMQAYGTQIVGGVNPGHGGQQVYDVPIFDLVEQAVTSVGVIDASVVFVSPYSALDAVLEAIAAGIRQLILITSGIPPLDMVRISREAEATKTLILGPNSPGLIIPEHILLGTHPAHCYMSGNVGLVSRSTTSTYEIAFELTRAGLGQSIAVGTGSDPIVGSSLQHWLSWLDHHNSTDVIVMVGEAGSQNEEIAARYIAETIQKPVIAYLAGHWMPHYQPLDHAQAIAASRLTRSFTNPNTAANKVTALRKSGVLVADRPSEVVRLVKRELRRKRQQVRA